MQFVQQQQQQQQQGREVLYTQMQRADQDDLIESRGESHLDYVGGKSKAPRHSPRRKSNSPRRKPVSSSWHPTRRTCTCRDGTSRTLFSNPAFPGDLRVRRMTTRNGSKVAVYVKPNF